MAHKILTEVTVKNTPPPKAGQDEHFDAALPGFALRVTPKGTKSFVFFYRVNGKQRRSTLGRYPALSLADARDRAREILRLLDAGEDPRRKRYEQEKEIETAQVDTYAGAVDDFIQKYAIAKKGNRSWKKQQQMLMNAGKKLDAKGGPIKTDRGWADTPITEITRRHIHDALDARIAAGKPYMANRTHEVLRTLYRWLYSRDRVPENLMDRVEKPFDGETVSDRAWSDAEVKALWAAADKLDGFLPSFLKLLILMGQRRNEIAGIRWDELDLDEGVWTLSVERHKGKRGHRFPLSALAVRILKGLPRVEGSPFAFPGRSDEPLTVGHRLQRRIQKISGVGDFTFKTARHTFRTGLDRLKVPPHIKLECLGHARQGVGDIHYSHYDYLDEQREAFEAWASHVEKLVYPDGVVGLHG